MWTETDANRGSNEITSYVLMFIEIMKEWGSEQFSYFSDNCAGHKLKTLTVLLIKIHYNQFLKCQCV